MGKKIVISIAAIVGAVAITASSVSIIDDGFRAPATVVADLPGGGGGP